jgi:hypothetical protein
VQMQFESVVTEIYEDASNSRRATEPSNHRVISVAFS